jgi:hypothetical protein
MMLIMGASMALHSVLASLAGAGLLIVMSVVCAAFSRRHLALRVHIVDLWAMALTMIAMVSHGPALPQGAAAHHGGAQALPMEVVLAGIVIGWMAARLGLALRSTTALSHIASAVVTVTGLGLMVLVGH